MPANGGTDRTRRELRTPEILVTSDDEVRRQPVNMFTFIYEETGVPIPIQCEFLDSGAIVYFPFMRKYHHRQPHFTRLFLFASGGADVVAAGQTYRLEPQVIYLAPANQEFHIKYRRCDLFFFRLLVHDASGISVFDSVEGIPGLIGADALFQEIVDSFHEGQTIRRQMLVMEAIFHFCQPLIGELGRKRVASSRFEQILAYVQKYATPSTTIDDLAAMCHLSRHALSKGFQRAMGVTLSDYMANVQLSRVKSALVSTNKSMETIAFELGFSEPSYLFRIFKKQTGLTPKEYRRTVAHT